MNNFIGLTFVIILWTGFAFAQESFVNYETPQTKPIAVATLKSIYGPNEGTIREFVLACNTPDNSLAIISTIPSGPSPATYPILARVPTGLGPATVRFLPSSTADDLGYAFVCNFDGDSVTVVRLELQGDLTISAVLERTMPVGNEPADIAFMANRTQAIVSLSGGGGFRIFSVPGMTPISAQSPFTVPSQFPDKALKAPRTLIVANGPSGDRTFALNFQSDDVAAVALPQIFDYDADIFSDDPSRLPGQPRSQINGGLGTTHHNAAMDPDGTRMFVVGTKARNNPLLLANRTESTVKELELGFVESHLWVVNCAPTQPISVVPEAIRGVLPTTSGPFSINLNQDYSQVQDARLYPPSMAISQPTDVAVIDIPGQPLTLALTGFHSDNVVFLIEDNTTLGGWFVFRVDIPVSGTGYSASGPRGLAFSRYAQSYNNQNGLVFVLNRLSNSVVILNPDTRTLLDALPIVLFDPTPNHIREGRNLLYSSSHSDSGIVSCASCHVDGRTDGLPWDLSSHLDTPVIKPYLHDFHGIANNGIFPTPKGVMSTQTLQGLVTFPILGSFQQYATSAPYHWRGDRAGLVDFRDAYADLLGGAKPSFSDMAKFEVFINSIMHPPNPEQNIAREMSGTVEPNIFGTVTQGTGELFGQQLFHSAPLPTCNSRSCVDCHALPDGGNSRLTFGVRPPQFPELAGIVPASPMATAELRNLTQREALTHAGINSGTLFNRGTIPLNRVGTTGLIHEGSRPVFEGSIHNVIAAFFGDEMPGPTEPQKLAQLNSIIGYVRGLDSGSAPAIGRAITWDPSNPNATTLAAVNQEFDLFESQANEANIGVVAIVRTGVTTVGYYWDVLAQQYRAEGSSTIIPRATLLQADRVIGLAVPVGSERRGASSSGVATLIEGPSPTSIQLLPMAPMTANVEIGRFLRHSVIIRSQMNSLTPSMNVMNELLTSAASVGFGLVSRAAVDGATYEPKLMSEPPRRLRVTGNSIRHGARLRLGVPRALPPTSDLETVDLPIFPTDRFTALNERIWETAVELDVLWQLAFLNGGLHAPGVNDQIHFTPLATGLPFDPTNWNKYSVQVVNETAPPSAPQSPWPSLTVQYGR